MVRPVPGRPRKGAQNGSTLPASGPPHSIQANAPAISTTRQPQANVRNIMLATCRMKRNRPIATTAITNNPTSVIGSIRIFNHPEMLHVKHTIQLKNEIQLRELLAEAIQAGEKGLPAQRADINIYDPAFRGDEKSFRNALHAIRIADL